MTLYTQTPNEDDRMKFTDVRAKHLAQSQNAKALYAFDLLSLHFPTYRQAGIMLDLITTWQEGGTFLANWNLTPEEARCAIAVLKEINCPNNCFYIVPIPSWKGFPLGKQKEMHDILLSHTKLFPNGLSGTFPPFPKYFSVHTTSRNKECVEIFRDLALARLMDDVPSVEIAMLEEFATGVTDSLMKKFMMKKL